MPIGITDEHLALHAAARGWAERHSPPSVLRAQLDAKTEALPEFWPDLVAQGWTGLHLEEALGGEGYGIPELTVVLEELGFAGAPGPFLATALAGAVLQAAGKEAAAELGPRLADGSLIGTVALSGSLAGEPGAEGALRVSGTLRPVLSGHLASLLIANAGGTWVVLPADAFEAHELDSVDLTRRVAEITVAGVSIPPHRQLPELSTQSVRDLAAVLFSADAVGGSQWCVQTASEYAKDRRQFGRPIGQFQGVKHRCANMLGRTELARVATWDAARGGRRPGHRVVRGCGRRVAVRRRLLPDRQGLRADPRRHRLHVGARRARLPPPGHGDPRAARHVRDLAGAFGPARARRGEAAPERRPPGRGRSPPRGAARAALRAQRRSTGSSNGAGSRRRASSRPSGRSPGAAMRMRSSSS